MKSSPLVTTVFSLAALAAVCSASPFATAVIQYDPGTNFAKGYTNTSAILGAPSKQSDDPAFGTSPVDPFDPPYLTNQIVSIGVGGSITVAFDTPILHDPAHPYGLDFLVFGHAGFETAPPDYSIANGTLFENGATQTVVSVSADGTNFFSLNPAKAPVLDALFPIDGSGNPGIPVNPALTASNFAGLDLAGVRALYAGSAGGAGFDIAWAIDGKGNPVSLSSISYVRLQVVSGKADIDALSACSYLPPSLSISLGSGIAQFGFVSRSNAVYRLQRTADFQTWGNLGAALIGDGGRDQITDTNLPVAALNHSAAAIYRLEVQ